jgi:lambda family phage portal protein
MAFFDFLRSKPSANRKGRRDVPFIPSQLRSLLTAAGQTRLETTWTTTPTTADALIYKSWGTIVARSREQTEHNDHARKFVMMMRDNIAGPNGFVLNGQVRDPNGEPDTLASQALEDAFAIQSELGNFDVTGTMSRSDTERLAVTTLVKDGEAIAVFRFGKDLGPFGFAIQMVDPMLLDHQHFEELPSGNLVRHGIEYDSNSRPVAYHFREFDQRLESYTGYTSKVKYNRVEAKYVVHAFVPEIIGQKRGLPWMRTALGRLRMLSAFEDSALVNARIGAAKMGFFRDPEANADEVENLPMDAEPGVFENIGNKEFVAFNPAFPDPFMGQFTQSLLRSIASGLGISYNNLASDLTNVNFSSIRQGTLEDREFYKGVQQWFASAWCKKIYAAWLEVALLGPNLTVAGKPLKVERKNKYMAVTFQGRRWTWIDPMTEVQANVLAIQNNLKSQSSVIRDGGEDAEDTFLEIKREKDMQKKLGIEPPPPPGSPMSQKNAEAAKENGKPKA